MKNIYLGDILNSFQYFLFEGHKLKTEIQINEIILSILLLSKGVNN